MYKKLVFFKKFLLDNFDASPSKKKKKETLSLH